jgi:hypothetical protein
MQSWRARLLMLLTVVAMLLAVSGPAAMADIFNHHDNDIFDNHDNRIFDNNDNRIFFDNRSDVFDDGCIGTTIFGHCTGVETGDNFFDNQGLDTINVGPLECLVDEDRVDFCVNDNGNVVFT